MMHRPKRKLKRRQLDIPRTLHAYEMRIRSLPRDKLLELEGAWVSSYDLWNTIPASSFEEEYEVRRDNSDLDSSVLRLTSVALEKEIKIRGCTSERRHYGVYVAALGDETPREQQKIIFCGDHTAFTNKSPHPIFSLKPHDKRYYRLPPEVPEVVPRVEITQEEGDPSLSDMSEGSI